MIVPPPVALAQEIAPKLSGLPWAIGGSVLMWKLGLEPAPHDLDVMTDAEHFPRASALIAEVCGLGRAVSHPRYRSGFFRRFDGHVASVDLMADVKVQTANGLVSWEFDPAAIVIDGGLPWMRAQDWLVLYQLFDRPERVKVLRQFISGAHRN
jgi:hypothetical protein